MLPVRPIRAALLAFIAGLALAEVGAGLVAGQAWRLESQHGTLSFDERWQLHQMLERLRVMEDVVVAGVVATTLLWMALAVHNATRGARGSVRAAMVAAVAGVATPMVFLALRAVDDGEQSTTRWLLLAGSALVLYAPFWATGRVSEGIGGPRTPFLRWWLGLAASFVVHEVFTTSVDLSDPQPSDDFGRTAMMFLINAVVVAVMALMAAEATREMERATDERALTYRVLHDDANMRMRSSTPLAAPAPEPARLLPPPQV